jgi:hypothetical protein
MVMESDTLAFPAIKGLDGVKSHDTCGECAFYRCNPGNFKEGTCYGNPPVVMFTQKGPLAVRAAVQCDDLGCRFHKK